MYINRTKTSKTVQDNLRFLLLSKIITQMSKFVTKLNLQVADKYSLEPLLLITTNIPLNTFETR